MAWPKHLAAQLQRLAEERLRVSVIALVDVRIGQIVHAD